NRIPAPNPSPEQALIQQEMRQTVNHAIMSLPLHHREMIVLRDINDFSYEEIAKICACETGTVKSRIARARDALRDILKNAGITDWDD
ncbi:MAG: sigma-70 family RNA polymerase sigma factor, partial [bacterium]